MKRAETMTKLRQPLILVALIFGCSPSAMHNQFRADAISAVSSHMTDQDRQSYKLQAHTNPWGEGAIVSNSSVSRTEDVRLWVYGDATAFALDEDSRRLTEGLSPVDAASENLQRRFGLGKVSKSEIRARVFRAITQGTPLPETQ